MRKRLPFFLNILLIMVASAAILYGSYMLINLRSSLLGLEEDLPNLEFVLLKDITLNINAMEEQALGYRYDKDSIHLQSLDSIYFYSQDLLDSLKLLNPDDSVLKVTSDSVAALYADYYLQLIDFGNLDGSNISLPFRKIEDVFQEEMRSTDTLIVEKSINITEEKPRQAAESVVEDDEGEPKPGLFKRLFGSKKEEKVEQEPIEDTVTTVVDTVERIVLKPGKDNFLLVERYLDSLKWEFYNQQIRIGRAELNLSRRLSLIQKNIIELLSFIESREITKSEIEALKAKAGLAKTRKQVYQVAFILGLIILLTVIGLVVFLNKNQKYQHILEVTRNQAEEYARTKQLFVAKMSHEIRTPMNAILGFTEQLKQTKLTKTQEEYLDIVNESSDHLLHLLNDILDISKFQNSRIKLENKPFDIRQLAEEVIKLLNRDIEKKKLKFLYHTSELKEYYFIGDPHRVKQIILNLLTNSIKFTEQGKIQLKIKSVKSKSGRSELIILVSDTGKGMKEEEQKKIFGEFEQLNSDQMSSGAGLGLAIIKHIVDLYKGTVAVKSKPGVGTTFRIKLPLRIADEKEPVVLEKPLLSVNGSMDLSYMKVLVADDEGFNRRLLQKILNKHKIKAVESWDGESAFKEIEKSNFDLVFLDLKMPLMNGHEVVKKAREINKRSIYIAVTATAAGEELDKSVFDEVILKPFKEREIIEVLKKYDPSSRHSDLTFSLDSLTKIGDEKFVSEMLKDFVKNTKDSLKKIMEENSNNNFSQTSELLHKIKGPAHHLDAKSFVSAIVQMEKISKSGKQIEKKELNILQEEFSKLSSDIEEFLNGS